MPQMYFGLHGKTYHQRRDLHFYNCKIGVKKGGDHS